VYGRALCAGLGPDGFNTGLHLGEGAGGAIGDHIRTRVVPRWEGDTNFMPVVGQTNVIVEAVDDTYERLHEGFAAQSEAESADRDTAVEIAFD
jgi:ATP adenylyltransferase